MTRSDYLMIRLVPVYLWNENLCFEQNRSSSTFQPIFNFYIPFIYLQQWVKKYTSVLNFLGKQRYLVAYIGEGNKSIGLQKLAWKGKLSHKMNESRHNQYIKNKSVKVPSDLKLKTAKSRFVFQIFPVNKSRWFVSSNWIYSPMKTSVKLPFVAKNSKHLVGTSGDDSSALIEFTPLWKTRVSNYLLKLKKEIWLAVYSRSNLIGVTYIHLSLTHSLTDPLTRP